MRNITRAAIVLALLLLTAACGGGSGTPDPDPTPMGAGIDGQLVQGEGQKVTSAPGDSLGGINVELINALSGELEGATVTDAQGRFSFRQLPSGNFMLRVRFMASIDLDGDGSNDEIDMLVPIELLRDTIVELLQTLEFDDSDDTDTELDSIKVDIRLTINGTQDHKIQFHRHRHGRVDFDDDGDGNIDDSFDDDDNNGLPEDDDFQGRRGPKLSGEIEAISDTGITVAGQEFMITEATHFRIRGNRDADPGQFEVGDEVQVTSFINADGDRIALEIKLKHDDDNPGNDDELLKVEGFIDEISADEIVVNGRSFVITEFTIFLLTRDDEGEPGDFAVGDFVEIKARLINDVWTALRIRAEDMHDDDDDEDDDERELKGIIEALSATSITIDGTSFEINEETEFFVSGNDPGSLEDFDVGDRVELKVEFIGDEWVVTRLKLEDDQSVELRGTIEAISSTGVTVDGQEFMFDSGTEFFIEGNDPGTLADFDVGDEVELKADFEGGQYFVSRLKLEQDDDEDDERTLTGVIEAINATSVVIDGETFTIDGETSFLFFDETQATIDDFAVDAEVELIADLESGVWVVRSLRLTQEPTALGDFSIDFTEFGPHLGHNFYLKVKEADSGETVAEEPYFAVSATDFNITIPDILEEGKEYNIDFWADFNGNGTLDGTPIADPPGVDHAWRLTDTADADGISLSFVHDTNFTDIRPF